MGKRAGAYAHVALPGMADLLRRLNSVKAEIRKGIDLQQAQETAKKGEVK